MLANKLYLMVHITLYCSAISHQIASLCSAYLLWTHASKIALAQSLTLVQLQSETDFWLA